MPIWTHFGRAFLLVVSVSMLSACTYLEGLDLGAWRDGFGMRATAPDPAAVPQPQQPPQPPLATRHFEGVAADAEVLGGVQMLYARDDNTLVQIAREYNVGYEELRHANPGVDVWLPGEGTPIVLPTMNIVPEVAREGIVLNLPSMRLLYFVADEPGDPAESATFTVTSHPIGIGRQGWATPTGVAEVTGKAREPVWYPPASVRAEHAALGDPLPSIVPAGPDNPLGAFAIGLSMPGYLIHGTNKPAGVGMRVSHGCIRLFPEDIEALFDRVPSGTPVTIVDEPVLAGWREGELYLEVHAPLAEDERDLNVLAEQKLAAAFERAGLEAAPLDAEVIARIIAERRGIPFPIMSSESDLDGYLASARHIENTLPLAIVETAAQTSAEPSDFPIE